MSASALKEDGNERFKNGDYEKALSLYTEALELNDIKETDKAIIYKNRAMCHLKLEEYDDAIKDATSGQFTLNPLPEDKILDWFKMKQIADDISMCI